VSATGAGTHARTHARTHVPIARMYERRYDVVVVAFACGVRERLTCRTHTLAALRPSSVPHTHAPMSGTATGSRPMGSEAIWRVSE